MAQFIKAESNKMGLDKGKPSLVMVKVVVNLLQPFTSSNIDSFTNYIPRVLALGSLNRDLCAFPLQQIGEFEFTESSSSVLFSASSHDSTCTEERRTQ